MGKGHPAHHRLHRHRAVHQSDAGDGSVAVGGGVGQGRRVTAVRDGAGPGRKDRSEGPPPHGGYPCRFAANGARFPRQSDGHR